MSGERTEARSDAQAAEPLALRPNDLLGAGAEAWESWKAKLDAIADDEGLTPKANPLPGELDVWRKHWAAGKTPAQAWRAVPYKSGRFG